MCVGCVCVWVGEGVCGVFAGVGIRVGLCACVRACVLACVCVNTITSQHL